VSISDIATRLGGWPRRVLALCCLLIAAATAVSTHRTGAARPESPVVIAARDLPAGTRLVAADLKVRSWPDDIRPPNAVAGTGAVLGHRLAGAIRAHEALTTTRLAGADLTAGLPATLQAVPVAISGGAAQGFVHTGDSIDLLVGDPSDAVAPRSASARLVATAVRVLAVTSTPDQAGSGDNALIVVVAADRATTLRIAAVSGRSLLAAVRVPP
jgi:pilus assembly protein CpaB